MTVETFFPLSASTSWILCSKLAKPENKKLNTWDICRGWCMPLVTPQLFCQSRTLPWGRVKRFSGPSVVLSSPISGCTSSRRLSEALRLVYGGTEGLGTPGLPFAPASSMSCSLLSFVNMKLHCSQSCASPSTAIGCDHSSQNTIFFL